MARQKYLSMHEAYLLVRRLGIVVRGSTYTRETHRERDYYSRVTLHQSAQLEAIARMTKYRSSRKRGPLGFHFYEHLTRLKDRNGW